MIRLIATIDQQRGIAKHGDMPWLIPEDLQYFKDQTTSHGATILMGSATFDTLGEPLPGRQNIVLTTKPDRKTDGVTYTSDLEGFMNNANGDIWVIGGASVYEQTVNLADELYITHVEATFGCDQFFPVFEHAFEKRQQTELHTENGFIFYHSIYGKL